MSFYHLPTDTERHPGRLERKLSDGALLGPPDTGWSEELAALCGFVRVVPGVRPADTASTTAVRSLSRVGDTVTEVWSVVPKSPDTLAAEQSAANRGTLDGKLRAALTTNATYLAIASPTNAQNAAQVKALTRQVNALVRMAAADLLADVAGT